MFGMICESLSINVMKEIPPESLCSLLLLSCLFLFVEWPRRSAAEPWIDCGDLVVLGCSG